MEQRGSASVQLEMRGPSRALLSPLPWGSLLASCGATRCSADTLHCGQTGTSCARSSARPGVCVLGEPPSGTAPIPCTKVPSPQIHFKQVVIGGPPPQDSPELLRALPGLLPVSETTPPSPGPSSYRDGALTPPMTPPPPLSANPWPSRPRTCAQASSGSGAAACAWARRLVTSSRRKGRGCQRF